MVFASALFLFMFLPITFVIHYSIKEEYRNTWLFFMSFIFYAWGGLIYALLVIFSTVVNYVIGLIMDKKEGRERKICMILSVVYNLSVLGFFKYFNFIIDNIEILLGGIIPGFEISAPIVPLPIGISFFTFQIMSYNIDLYRKEIKVQKNPIHLGLYIMLFPQLIAGPIVRYIDVQNEIDNREIRFHEVIAGFKRFVIGLAKKVVIANAMGAWADTAFNNIHDLSTPLAWLGIIGYTMQIYFDFSAYSDMAIGIGRMLGFHFLENFNYPYIAICIQDFWRRWHMSLTTWFRDYLYIPLGGNRKGKKRTYINNLIVFFCTGLWHGAAWSFIFWGFFHGFIQMFEKTGIGKKVQKLPKPIGHMYTMLIVLIGWVLFRANSLSDAMQFYKYMFTWNVENLYPFFKALDNWKIFTLLLALIFMTPIMKVVEEKINRVKSSVIAEGMEYLFYTVLFLISIMFVSGSTFNPFIYFRF